MPGAARKRHDQRIPAAVRISLNAAQVMRGKQYGRGSYHHPAWIQWHEWWADWNRIMKEEFERDGK